MRKILSFLMMTLFSVSLFAADPVEIAKATFNGKTATYTEGWTTTGTGVSRTDCIVIGKGENITSPSIDLSAYDSISITFTGRRYGSLAGSKATVSAAYGSTELGTIDITSSSVGNVSGNIGYKISGTLSASSFVFTCTNATSAGSSHGAGIGSITITGVEKSVTPEPTTKTLYLNPGVWAADNAKFGVYYFVNNDDNGFSDIMTLAENETAVYTTTIPAKYNKVIFIRLKNTATTVNWSDKWNQSADQEIPEGKDLFSVTGWGDNDGSWSKYSPSEPPAPAEPDSIYFVNVPGWDNLRVHLWGGTATGTTWPGVEMTKLGEDDQINGYDVYKYVADKGAYTQCIFSNNGENKTADLNWTSGKYYYDGAWYAKADIPEPIPAAVPLEGNIWKVTAETPVRAGSHYIDEALLKVDGVYATTLKPNTRTIAGEDFTHAIQVRTDGYPTQDVLAGKEKSGSTSLIITAKENADITLYYNRQAIDATGTENDNKDLIVFDQAAITTKLTGEFKVIEVLEGNSYLNATKKIALKKDHVYTVTASGTTLQLHGIKIEEHVPTMQIAGAWDVKEDQSWVVNNMTLAGDAKTATYEVELSKGDYEFKVLKDGAWLTKANEGAYGLHREWPGVAGVTDDAANNLKLTADAAGKYIFTWTFANDSIGITFPAPEPTKYFLKNNWDGAETWTWKEMTNDNGSYILAEVVFGGEGVNINTAESDEGASWIEAEDIETYYNLSYEPAILGALDTVVFIFDPEAVNTYEGESGLSAIILGKYVAPDPQPVLADGFYLIGKIGGVEGWNVADLKAEQKFAPNLDNPVEFMLDVTLAEGDELKVVNVLNNEITAWFPGGESSNFVVTAAYAGEKTVYFRPDNQGGEGWHYGCIYIAPNQGTGISNTAVEGKAVKMIMDGQLLIIRNGKTYNVQGQQLK